MASSLSGQSGKHLPRLRYAGIGLKLQAYSLALPFIQKVDALVAGNAPINGCGKVGLDGALDVGMEARNMLSCQRQHKAQMAP